MANQFILRSARAGSSAAARYMLVPAGSGGLFSLFGPLTRLLFSPLKLVSSILFLPFSLFSFSSGRSAGVFTGVAKVIALAMIGILYFDRGLLDGKMPGWQYVIGVPALFCAVMALCSSVFNSLRVVMISAFWFAGTLFLGQAVLGTHSQSDNGSESIRYVQADGDREYFVLDEDYARRAGLREASYAERVQETISGVGSSVSDALSSAATGVTNSVSSLAGSVQDSVSGGVSEVLTTLNLSNTGFGGHIMDSIGHSGGVLPDAAFFPPVRKTKGFYPMASSRSKGFGSSVLDQMQGFITR